VASGRLSRIWAVAHNTFRETVRQRVLYNLVFFAILMTLSGLLLGQLSVRQDEKVIKDLGLASIEIFGTLIAVFIGISLVGKEIEQRSLYPLLAKPLQREEFLVGKFVGLCLTLLVNVVAMTLGLYITLAATHRALDMHLLKAIVPLYMSLVLVTAVALLFSTLTSTVLAAICTTALVVAGRFVDVIRNMHDVVPGAPLWLTNGLYHIIPNLQFFNFKEEAVYGDPIPMLTIVWVVAYGAAYSATALLLAVAAFRRREMV
jgi:ABC-type transport system involved in multi-copper enzyme maturation permease subunit